ncbi:hypothetical protein KFU94_69790 [Chloroflexi bacterium TSY]|nr:hypothetical protein [Chloroflexi bacterium TSY]
MSILQIRLLGEFAFFYQKQAVPGVQTKRLQSLLAYLLLHTEQKIARRQLSFLFWPGFL